MKAICNSCGAEQTVDVETYEAIPLPDPDAKVYDGFRILTRIETPVGNYRVGVKGCPAVEGIDRCMVYVEDLTETIKRTMLDLCKKLKDEQ